MTGGFTGSKSYKVDGKGRVSIPAQHRRVFQEQDPDWSEGKRARLRLTYSIAGRPCLELYTIEAVTDILARARKLPRNSNLQKAIFRRMNTHADDLEIDDEGRLVLAKGYRDYLRLDPKGDQAQFVAGFDTLEIWNTADWAEEEAAEMAAIEAELGEGVDPLSLLPEL